MGAVELAEQRREIHRAHQRRDRDALAAILVALERRAVAAWAGEDAISRDDGTPAAAILAITLQLRAWIWDLAERGAFRPWSVLDRGDLHDLEIPPPSIDDAGRVAGDMAALATVIIRGGARSRGWVAPGDLEL